MTARADTIYDFAIIGAGMAGASIAAELAPFANVLLLEAEDQPGYHATGRSAAFWTESYGGPAVQPLTTASGPFLADLGLLDRRGALTIATTEQLPQLDSFIASFASSGVVMERLDHAGVARHIPRLDPQIVAGVFEPDCCDIDVAALHQHYLTRAAAHGAVLQCRAAVTAFSCDGAGWLISTLTGCYRAFRVINAAGAWADDIAQMAGMKPVGITPYRRTVAQLRTSPPPPAALPLVLDAGEAFYFKPESGRLWLSPHDETPSLPCDAAADELDVALAIDRFQQVAGWQIEAVEHRWAGLRSFAPDRLPVYGADPADPSFIWFAGQGGFGIQTAPAAARMTAQQLLGHPTDAMTQALDPARYSPSRFTR